MPLKLKAIELHRWTARETRWKRYIVSRKSPVRLINLRPSSDRNVMPVVFIIIIIIIIIIITRLSATAIFVHFLMD